MRLDKVFWVAITELRTGLEEIGRLQGWYLGGELLLPKLRLLVRDSEHKSRRTSRYLLIFPYLPFDHQLWRTL